MKTVISWNVNGIRAARKKGFLDWLKSESPDIACVQETKAMPEQVDSDLEIPDGYKSYWFPAVRKGYSGVATFVKERISQPTLVENLGMEEFDVEGRTQVMEFSNFFLINAYFPNSQAEGARLDYKINFCDAILERSNELIKAGKNVVICGDYNIAHKPIDLANPKRNEKNPGYLPEEREWMDKFIGSGYTDTFRMFNDQPDQYTWWSYRFKARDKNIGWRIDYHCVNDSFKEKITNTEILSDILGSDHCPVKLTVSE